MKSQSRSDETRVGSAKWRSGNEISVILYIDVLASRGFWKVRLYSHISDHMYWQFYTVYQYTASAQLQFLNFKLNQKIFQLHQPTVSLYWYVPVYWLIPVYCCEAWSNGKMLVSAVGFAPYHTIISIMIN